MKSILNHEAQQLPSNVDNGKQLGIMSTQKGEHVQYMEKLSLISYGTQVASHIKNPLITLCDGNKISTTWKY